MIDEPTSVSEYGSSSSPFPDTRWSIVELVGDPEEGLAVNGEALEELCEIYHKPIHRYLCRLGYSADYAKDLTQSFFLKSLEKKIFARCHKEKGKLRSYLCASLKTFLADEARYHDALKRGSKFQRVDDDVSDIEHFLESDHGWHPMTPDKAFDRHWAETILSEALKTLREEFEKRNRSEVFRVLSKFLSWRATEEGPQLAAAEELGMAPNAFGMQLQRTRKRLATLIETQIARTVASREALKQELAYFYEILREPNA